MNDTQSQTESLLDIVKGIDNRTIMLPEFQRDFRWELERTYALFDSLVREIFIGTIIYGKPAFGMTLREIDRRPRKGKGSNVKLTLHNLSSEDIKRRAQTQNLRIVLDGQQRLTSIYRAIVGTDNVYLILKDLSGTTNIGQLSLEAMFDNFAGEERPDAISINLGLAYDALGEARQAITFFEQALVIAREIGDREREAGHSWSLGLALEKQGELARAAALMQLYVEYLSEIGHPEAEKRAARVEQVRQRLAGG